MTQVISKKKKNKIKQKKNSENNYLKRNMQITKNKNIIIKARSQSLDVLK